MDSLQASRIAGGNTAYKRAASDFYPTPPDVTFALMKFLSLEKGGENLGTCLRRWAHGARHGGYGLPGDRDRY